MDRTDIIGSDKYQNNITDRKSYNKICNDKYLNNNIGNIPNLHDIRTIEESKQ